MKISHRIILVNLIIVSIVLGSAAVAFYSIMYNSFSSQQSKSIISSSRNFLFTYRSFLNDIDEEFLSIKNNNPNLLFEKSNLTGSINDFFLESSPTNVNQIIRYSLKNFVVIPKQNFSIEEFIKYNPYVIMNSFKLETGNVYYFGKIINGEILNDFAQRIGADVALILDNFTAEVSNSASNTQNIFLLSKAFNYLKSKGDFEVFQGESEAADIIATVYKLDNSSGLGNNLAFLIFKSHSEATDLRETLRNILLLIAFVGIILALILAYVLTHKLRLRIADLNYATSKTSEGKFNIRIDVKGKDEIGKLGKAFNLMLDELEKNQRAKNEYSEFITLINQNASLAEISNAALKKIIETCGFVIGALYSIDEGEVSLICSHGLSQSDSKQEQSEIFKRIITTKEPIEISAGNSLPTINTGTVELKLSHLLLIPVIYNNKVIAILELASLDKPTEEAKEYLAKIQEQLAIGLTNAKAVVQLENFVAELKKLNEEYQRQNIQIKKQNETLIKLSNQLKAKAEELALQKERAEESTKLKSQFLASMSHELRTPMNSILGLTELIVEKAQLSGKNKERLEVVLKNGKRLMSLINDILDLSKIESGKMEIRDEDVLLEEMIEEVSSNIRPLALEKGISFVIQRKCNTRIIVNTDRVRVTQVLINLLGNGIKFTEKGKIELVVSLALDKMLQFAVSDTGIGISEDNQKLIFEEFRQLDGSTTRKYSGTGLGLAICKKIIDLLGGKIWLESAEGKGSTFLFTIPIQYQHEGEKETSQSNNLDGLRKKTQRSLSLIDDREIKVEKFINNSSARILLDDHSNDYYGQVLIVDDDADTLFTLNEIVQAVGCKTHLAKSGIECLRLLEQIHPDLILLDIMMPEMDGFQTLNNIRANNHLADIPIYAVTAKAMSGDKEIILKHGFNDYIAKPVNSTIISNKIEQLFSKIKTNS
jgi:two-component system chemotaxis sensor kinase CheA